MVNRHHRRLPSCLLKFVPAILLVIITAQAQDKSKPDVNKIPKRVIEALKGRFPGAQIDKWTREKEGDVFIHDIEFKQDGQKLEADIREDGTIQNWEKEIPVRDLPDAVRKAVEKKYPKAAIKEVMAVTEVKEGKDVLEGYEVGLEIPGGKDAELTVAPDGKILEDSGESQAKEETEGKKGKGGI